MLVLVVRRPALIDMSQVYRQSSQENLEQAFSMAERELGVTRLLDPEGWLEHFLVFSCEFDSSFALQCAVLAFYVFSLAES